MEEACSSVADAPKIKMVTKKMLKGHINKVNSVHFSGDSRFVSLLQFLFSFGFQR
jgi:guanine nucleotide-binding protein subunit beta